MLAPTIVAFEAWAHFSEETPRGDRSPVWCCWVGTCNASGVHQIWKTMDDGSHAWDALSSVLMVLAKNGDQYGTEIEEETLRWGFRKVSQTFVVDSAMRKSIRRGIQERLGGVPGWRPVYYGSLTVDKVAGRERVSAHGDDKRPDALIEPDAVEQPDAGLYEEGDQSFAARRRQRRLVAEKLEQQAAEVRQLEKAGRVHVKALHSADGFANLLSQIDVVGHGDDGSEYSGHLVHNSTSVATILTVVAAGSQTVTWVVQHRGSQVLVGISEP